MDSPISFTKPSRRPTLGSACKAPSMSSTIHPSSTSSISSSKSTSAVSSFPPFPGSSASSPKRSRPVLNFVGIVVDPFVEIAIFTGSGNVSEIGCGHRANTPSASVHAMRFSRGEKAIFVMVEPRFPDWLNQKINGLVYCA